MQTFALIHCCMCGANHEHELPVPQSGIIMDDIVAQQYIENHAEWGYAPPTDEWMCHKCCTAPALFKVSEAALKTLNSNTHKSTQVWNDLIKTEIAAQLNIDADAVLASEVEVKAYMNPHSLECDFYIRPIGVTWMDIKKRHPAKRSKTWGDME